MFYFQHALQDRRGFEHNEHLKNTTLVNDTALILSLELVSALPRETSSIAHTLCGYNTNYLTSPNNMSFQSVQDKKARTLANNKSRKQKQGSALYHCA